MNTQTDVKQSQTGMTQTIQVELNDEDCQTDIIKSTSQEVQVKILPETSELGTDPDEDILKQIQKEVEKRIKDNFEIQQIKKKSL